MAYVGSVSVSSWSLDAQTLYKPTQCSQGRRDTKTAPLQAHSPDITFRAQGTVCSITELIVLSIVLTRGTRGKKNSKFKRKYHRNENVNVTHPIQRHAENGCRQKQYGRLGGEIAKNWGLLPAS